VFTVLSFICFTLKGFFIASHWWQSCSVKSILAKQIYLSCTRSIRAMKLHWLDNLQLPMESASITTNVVNSNHTQARCAQYNIMRQSL
jgi:hypothetical protein